MEIPHRAAILLVGNELLSGKIRDENGWFLSQVLRRRGIELVEISVVRDDVEAIGDAVQRLLASAPLLFTSGGVGPTHDDVTLEGVAAGCGRPIGRDSHMEGILRHHYGDRITNAALRMADLPRGTTLRAETGWPVLRLDVPEMTPPAHAEAGREARIYILPGIPALLRAKVEALEALDGELPDTGAWRLEILVTDLDESRLAQPLDEVVAEFPGVEIGSYPRWRRDDDGRLMVRVKLTFEAPADRAELALAAREALAARVGVEHVLDATGW